jgi:threonine dehydrogenase-like Zn-dependent dehydrogenase
VLFLSDILPTGYMGAEMCDIAPGDVVAVWGAGPVGQSAHGSMPVMAYDRAKQKTRLETDRPYALRQAILSCRSGGIVSVIGVYGGVVDKFPAGAFMNRALTLRTGQNSP